MAEQRDWGWTEAGYQGRRKAIQTLRLPRAITVRNNGSVSSAAVRHVLRVLNDYAGGDCETFVGRERIAQESGLSVSQVKRAIAALEDLGLLRIEFRKGRAAIVCNHYLIQWEAIERQGQAAPHPEAAGSAEPVAPAPLPSGAPVHGGPPAPVHSGPPQGERRSMVDRAPVHGGQSAGPPWTERRSMVDPDLHISSHRTPSPTPPPGWGEAGKALCDAGVKRAWQAIDQARRRGATPERVVALAEHYQRERQTRGWNAGVLYWRVCGEGPGLAIADGWPDAPRRPPPEETAARAEALERDCGALLDGLSAAELQDLASRRLRGNPTAWSLWQIAGLKDAIVRRAMLAAVAEELQPAAAAR